MAGVLDQVYKHLPIWAQHAAVTLYGVPWYWRRFGAGYAEAVRDYRQRDRFSPEQWADWTQRRLSEVLSLAAERVPYYRQAWSAEQKAGARAGRLQALPLLEKGPLRAEPGAFLREDVRCKPYVCHTSGSTGTPIACSYTMAELRSTIAVREVRSAGWAGVSFRDPRATFSGRLVEPDPHSRGPFHRYNAVEKQVYFSAFHLGPQTARQYVDALRRHRTCWLTGYAVSSYLLAKYIVEQDLPRPYLRAVITTSEKVSPAMRAVMEQGYGCPVFEEYSTVENVLFASACKQGRLHVSPDIGVVEILRPDGSACGPGEVGEVVATCLVRTLQPFVRFRLGDMAAWSGEPCPCGRSMPVIQEVLGRIEDVVVGPDGREMVRFHGIWVGQPHVQAGQIVQESLTHIHARVVPAPGYGPADEADIIARIQQRLTDAVRVTVETVDDLPRTPAGKVQAVISKLPKSR